jgi:hypothetical protein
MNPILDWLEDHPRVTLALVVLAYMALPVAFASAAINSFGGLKGWWR